MFTEYDKAIAAFLTSLGGILAAIGLPKLSAFFSPEVILAVTPLLAGIITWAVKNKPPAAPLLNKL